MSYVAQELLALAFSIPEIREEYAEAAEKFGEVKPKEDLRVRGANRPWVRTYEIEDKDTKSGLSREALSELVTAKREGRMTKQQEETAAKAATSKDKDSKREMLKSLLLELLEE